MSTLVADMSSQEIESLWNEYFPKVFGYFYRRLNCREDVEDLTSLVMTKFIHSLNEYDIAKPNAYLWRIAHNQLVNFYREKSKTPVFTSLLENEDQEWLDESLEQSRSSAYLQRVESLIHCAKLNLKGEEYLLVNSAILEDKKSAELAIELNTKPATIRKRLSRTLQKLRDKCASVWEGFRPQPNTEYAQ